MTEHYSIVMARKPLSEKSIAENVIKWGTGGINIDECRIGYRDEADEKSSIPGSLNSNQKNSMFGIGEGHKHNTEGRFPANIIFDEEAGKILDKQSGISKSVVSKRGVGYTDSEIYGKGDLSFDSIRGHNDEGGASRFFYQPKTNKQFNKEKINKKHTKMTNIKLMKGDCLKQLKKLKDNSVDSVVTDPPYEIGFMGKGWDDSGIANNPKLWKEILRVLKPGGHLLSFSHSRTYHRQAVAVEDAGFEIRDQIMWVYGSGFPKSHNIGKAVDKLQGNEREVVGEKTGGAYSSGTNNVGIGQMVKDGQDGRKTLPTRGDDFGKITKGNSPYEGWGTALKPAHEPIVMARKPFKGSVAQNVLEYGTGGINIDECRIETDETLSIGSGKVGYGSNMDGSNKGEQHSQGRFPANIIFDEEAGKILDEQSGILKSGYVADHHKTKDSSWFGASGQYSKNSTQRNDLVGGASRFFYCPKAQKKDRNEGCDALEEKQIYGDNGFTYQGLSNSKNPSKNSHPTVKPTDLMAYLVRLVTPKGGTVLDPFMGSGSTGKAAVREGMDFIGIEREDEYMEIAKTRIEHEQSKHNYRKFFDAV